MKMFYEKDADVNLIKEKKVAIFGYGSQGHAHALNLKDSGVKEVVVALRDGSQSKAKAESKGLKVMNLSDAAEWAEIAMILTPDELQATIYKKRNRDTAWFSIIDKEWKLYEKSYRQYLKRSNFNEKFIQKKKLRLF